MNNNMTGTNTLNAIYENMGCKGEVVYNGGSLRPLSEDILYLNRVHETTGGQSRVEVAKQLAHGSVYGHAPSTRELWEGLIPRTEAKDVKDYFTVAKEVKRKCPSNLEVVPYVADKHAHLPDYAREMIEMIEEAEYEALNNYLNSKEQWSRNVVIDEEGNEVVTWVHVSEQALDPELEEYKKFLASSSFDVENDKSVPVGWEGETVALQTLFNLHVGDVD